jgi:subtilase family serine protease
VASAQLVKPDLTVEAIRWEKQSNNTILLTARVTNVGSLPSTTTTLSFKRDSQSGILLSAVAIPTLNVDQAVDIAIPWDTTGLTSREYIISIAADSSNSIDEYDETNNVTTLIVHTTSYDSSIYSLVFLNRITLMTGSFNTRQTHRPDNSKANALRVQQKRSQDGRSLARAW